MASCKEAISDVNKEVKIPTKGEIEILMKKTLNAKKQTEFWCKPGFDNRNKEETSMLMLKLSLTICLSSDDSSMRSLARSVLYDMFGVQDNDYTGKNLKMKLENIQLTDLSKLVQKLNLKNRTLFQQAVMLFNIALMVGKCFITRSCSILLNCFVFRHVGDQRT